MYFLYTLSNIFVISYVLYKIYDICTKPNKNLKLINQENKNIKLICTKFYNNDNGFIQKIDHNVIIQDNECKKIDLSYYLFPYKFVVIHYYYNDKIYNWIHENNNNSDNQIISFPFYKETQYKTYVYTNKIKNILIDNKQRDYMHILIEPFLGPNYNFYSELNYSIYLRQLLDYFNIEYNDSTTMTLCDNFNNQIEFKINDKLYWDPQLKLN